MFFWNRNKDEAMSSKNKAHGGPPKVVSIAASALGGVDEDESVVTHATAATSGSATGGAIGNHNDNRIDARPPPRSTATVGSDASTRSGGRGRDGDPNQVEDDDASSVMMNLLSALSFQPTPQQQQHHHHDDYHGKNLVSGPLAPLLIPLDAGEEDDDDSEDSVPTSLVGHKASALMRVKGAGFDVPPGVILTTKFFEPWIDEIRSSKEWDAAVDRLRHSVRVRSSSVGGVGEAIARPGDEAELRHFLDRLRKKASSLHLTKLQRAQMTAVGEELGASMGGTYAIRPSSTEYDVGITSLYGGSLNVRDSPSDHHRGLIRAIQKCWCSCLDERVLTLKIENRLNHHLGDEDEDEEASYLLPDLAVLIQTMVPNLYVSGVAYSINPTNNDHDQIVIRAAYGAGGGHHTKSPDNILVDSTTRSIVKYDVGGKGVHEAKVAAAEQRCLEEVHVRHVADAAAQIQHSSLYHGSSPPPVDVEWAVDARDQLHVLQVRPMVAGYVPMDRSVRTQPGAEHRRRLYLDGNLMWGGTDMSTSPMSNDILSMGVRHVVGTILMGRSPGSIRSEDIDLKKGMGLYTDSCRCYLDLSMYLPLLMGSPTGRMTTMVREANPIIAAVLDKDSSQPNEEEEDDEDDEWWDHLDAYRPPELPKHLRTSSLLYWAPGVVWRSRKLLISYWEANNRPAKFWRDYRRATSDFENWANDPDSIDGAGADRTTTTVVECLEEGMTKFVDVTLRATLPALILYERSARRIAELVAEASAGDDGCSPEEVRRIVDDLLGGGRTFDEDGDHSTVRMGLDLVEMANMLPPSSYTDLDALADAIENRDGGGGGGRLLPPGFLPRWDAFVASHGLRGPSEGDVASPKYGDTPMLLLRQMAAIASRGTSTSSRSLNLQDDDPRERQRNAVFRREEVLNELVRTLARGKGRELRRCHDDCVRYADASDTIRRHLLQVQGRVWLSLVDRARIFVELGWLDRAEDVFQLHVADVDEATVQAAAATSACASSGAGGSKKKRSKKNVDLRALVRKRGEFYRRVTATTTDPDGSRKKPGQQQGVVVAPHFPPVIDSRGRIFRCPPGTYTEGYEAGGSSLIGTAASPGVARGPVRILRGCGGVTGGSGARSRSKSRSARHPPIFRPGDVLVAPAADVGYIAPLLVGAAAVIFEVDGGCRGRGETLAREYGTPCVSGVEGATEILRDGRIVEVDGDAGVVRFVSDSTQFGLQ